MNYQKNFKTNVYRRIEVPTKLTCAHVLSHNKCQCCNSQGEIAINKAPKGKKNVVSNDKKDKASELMTPKLNSVLRNLDEINMLHQPPKCRKVTLDYATPVLASMVSGLKQKSTLTIFLQHF